MIRLILLAALVSLVSGPSLEAQQEISAGIRHLEPGTRIRVSAPALSGRGIRGTLLRAEGDTLLLLQKGDTLSLPLFRAESVDVSRGRNRVLGGAIGLGVGAVAGTLLLGKIYSMQGEFADRRGDNALHGSMLGMMVGAPVGLVTGAVIGIERWDRIAAQPEENLYSGARVRVTFAVGTPF